MNFSVKEEEHVADRKSVPNPNRLATTPIPCSARMLLITKATIAVDHLETFVTELSTLHVKRYRLSEQTIPFPRSYYLDRIRMDIPGQG